MTRILALLLTLLLPMSSVAFAQSDLEAPREGVDYLPIENGQRWTPANGKIEVVEVFAYWCPHCAEFQPIVDAWKAKIPADVQFSYVPAAFDPADNFARAYFAAEIAGAVPKTHNPLFHAIHEAGTLPRMNVTVDELGTYYASRGLNRARMIALMQSKDVDARMVRARAFAKANKVSGTPTVVLNGKYVVRGRSYQDRMRVLDYLIARERAAMKAAAKTAPKAAPRPAAAPAVRPKS